MTGLFIFKYIHVYICMCRHASVCALLLRSGEIESRIEYSVSLSIVQCKLLGFQILLFV